MERDPENFLAGLNVYSLPPLQVVYTHMRPAVGFFDFLNELLVSMIHLGSLRSTWTS